jgi:DNA polymerase-3 subunit epsilon
MVRVRDGKIVDQLSFLIQPPYPNNWFHEGNIRVHGIRPSDVDGAPTMQEALQFMLRFIDGDVLVAHNAPFDMGVLRASATLIQQDLPELQYACSLAIARKTYNLESYRLNAVAYAIGHEEFDHHDALADSDACARIIIHAADRHGAETMADLLKATKQVFKPIVKPTSE